MNSGLLALLLAAGAVAVGLAVVGLMALDGYRVVQARRASRRRLAAINADPSQHPIGV